MRTFFSALSFDDTVLVKCIVKLRTVDSGNATEVHDRPHVSSAFFLSTAWGRKGGREWEGRGRVNAKLRVMSKKARILGIVTMERSGWMEVGRGMVNEGGGEGGEGGGFQITFIHHSPLTVMAIRVLACPWKCSPFMSMAWKVALTVKTVALVSMGLRGKAEEITPSLLTLKYSELFDWPRCRKRNIS